jgi:Fe-Mn family superoxide dismutase
MTNEASRRQFLGHSLIAGASLVLVRSAVAQTRTAPPPAAKPAAAPPAAAPTPPAAAPPAPAPSHPSLALPALPYAQNALEPHISAATLSFHHGKHHQGYFDTVNKLVESTPMKGKSLDAIVTASSRSKAQQKLFNASAQAWNHSFYWQSMTPKGGGAPTGKVAERLTKDFGSYEAFKTQFIQTGVDHFSNGWVWLVLDKGKLKIVDTHDADTPVIRKQKPLLVSDVWEHAYYLDYKNLRKDYLTAFVDHLINWSFVEQNLG